MSGQSHYDTESLEWSRSVRQGEWVAVARRDERRGVWLLSAIDHNALTLTGECDGAISPEAALDRAEGLAT